MSPVDKINLSAKFNLISKPWDPKIIAELNGQHIKLAKFDGEFINHKHDHEDEFFLVLKGKLRMVFENNYIDVLPGECILIPRGTYHKPIGLIETEVLLFEPNTTINTGNIKNEYTSINPELI